MATAAAATAAAAAASTHLTLVFTNRNHFPNQILGVLAVVLGPENLSKMAKELGGSVGDLKKVPLEFQDGFEAGSTSAETSKLARELGAAASTAKDTAAELAGDYKEVAVEFSKGVRESAQGGCMFGVVQYMDSPPTRHPQNPRAQRQSQLRSLALTIPPLTNPRGQQGVGGRAPECERGGCGRAAAGKRDPGDAREGRGQGQGRGQKGLGEGLRPAESLCVRPAPHPRPPAPGGVGGGDVFV